MQIDLPTINQVLEEISPESILQWSRTVFGEDMAATSSFQTQSVPLLHMISLCIPGIPIYFLETGFHFPETLRFLDDLQKRFNLNIQLVEPRMGHQQFRYEHGELHRGNPDLCCYINKVEPLREVQKNYKVWISGIRRDQTQYRSDTEIVSLQKNGNYKLCPMARWTERDVWRYINQHELPVHPLLPQGYMSIGCAPCTKPVGTEQDSRSGRWSEQSKTECGLHIDH